MPAYDKGTAAAAESDVHVKNLLNSIAQETRTVLKKINQGSLKELEEIRLRAEKPLMVANSHRDWFVRPDGGFTSWIEESYIIKQDELMKTLELMSENSIYAYQDEIKNGYITLKGGHRVGIAGKTVLEGGGVKNIKDLSGLNIRISKEVPGCAKKIIRCIMKSNQEVFNTLLVSPPQCGKTTMLRDLARFLGDGDPETGFRGIKVGIVDERSEIAACYRGVPQNKVGARTDVLDCCPKSIGMSMLIRSMSPQVIITDEIGNQGDSDSILKVLNAGVKIIASVHGYNISELKMRYEVLSLIRTGVFDRFVVLSNKKGPGTIEEVIDGTTMKNIYSGG